MEEDSALPEDLSTRAARCCACGRPVWPIGVAEREEPPAPPELCDYCAAACQ
jgi:hypothetical protein